MLAAKHGHEAVARLLLDRGAEADRAGVDAANAVVYAAEAGRDAVVRLLVERGSAVTPDALMLAVVHDHERVARFLLEHGADVKAAPTHRHCRKTLLTTAAGNGIETMVRLLIERGADVDEIDADGGAPFFGAAKGGHVSVVRLLAERGADVAGTLSPCGETALMAAAQNGHVSMVRWLLEHDAEAYPDEANAMDGGTALSYAAGNGKEAVVLLLAEAGAQLDRPDHKGSTAIMHAVLRRHEGTVRLLAELGADVDAADERGHTAAMRLSTMGFGDNLDQNIPVATVLLSYGATRGAEEHRRVLGDVPLVRDCRAAVEAAVQAAGDRDVACLCGDYVSMVDRWRPAR